jgi:hypothetical protein
VADRAAPEPAIAAQESMVTTIPAIG